MKNVFRKVAPAGGPTVLKHWLSQFSSQQREREQTRETCSLLLWLLSTWHSCSSLSVLLSLSLFLLPLPLSLSVWQITGVSTVWSSATSVSINICVIVTAKDRRNVFKLNADYEFFQDHSCKKKQKNGFHFICGTIDWQTGASNNQQMAASLVCDKQTPHQSNTHTWRWIQYHKTSVRPHFLLHLLLYFIFFISFFTSD